MKDMKKILYTIAAAALCLTACQKELSEVQPVDSAALEGATVTVPFTVSIQTSNDPSTRADERIERPELKNLYIAIFGENGGMLQQFVPARQVRDFSEDPYGYTNQAEYVAELPLYDEECHLHFIGNFTGDIATLNFEYEKDFMDSRMTRRMRLRLIMHEICHAQEGCLDHGKKWRATAGLAENAFPDKYRGITDNFDGADMQAALARYMFKCPVCDYVYGTRSKRDRAMQGRALCPCCRVLLVRA